MSELAHYFVTDIECDGPDPARHSMLSFATVVVREDGELCGEFEAVLKPREDRCADENTIAFWKTIPDAWEAATKDARPAEKIIPDFVNRVRSYAGPRSFAARPLMFDGAWIDRYLRDFADCYLLDVPHWGEMVFTSGAMDIGTYLSGIFGRTDPHSGAINFPADWLGNHPHTHRAIDDARGYASLLVKLFSIARNTPVHPQDFLEKKI